MKRKSFLFLLSVFSVALFSTKAKAAIPLVIWGAIAIGTVVFVASDVFFENTIQAYMTGAGCWFCPLFVGIFKGIDAIATNVVMQLSGAFLMLLAAGLLFWIVFYVGKTLFQFQPIDISKFFTDLFGTTGKAVVAMALLYSFFGIYTYVLGPVLSMSVGLSNSIMESSSFSASLKKATETFANHTDGKVTVSLCKPVKKTVDGVTQTTYVGADGCAEGWDDGNHVFTQEMCSALECSVRSVSASLIGGFAVGSTFVQAAIGDEDIFDWDGTMLFVGLIILLSHFIILIMFPFKLIDALIRLGFVCALAPLFVVLWVFPATRQYTKKAWDMFLGSCMTFVFLAVVMVLVIELLTFSLPKGEALTKLLTFLLNGKDKEALTLMNFSTVQFFVTVAVCFIGWKLLDAANMFAQAFSSAAPSIGAGSALQGVAISGGLKAASMAQSTAVSGGKWAAKTTAKTGLRAASLGASGAVSAASALGLMKNTTDSAERTNAWLNARNNSASYMQGSDKITEFRDNNGLVNRQLITDASGTTRVMDGVGKNAKEVGVMNKKSDGTYTITDKNGNVVEQKTKNAKGEWEVSSFGVDQNGNSKIRKREIISQTGNDLKKTVEDYENNLKTVESASMANADDADAIMKAGGQFAASSATSWRGAQYADGTVDFSEDNLTKASVTKFDLDANGNHSAAHVASGSETRDVKMSAYGATTTRVDSNGVMHAPQAVDLSGAGRHVSFTENLGGTVDRGLHSVSTTVTKPKRLFNETVKQIKKKIRNTYDGDSPDPK